MLMHQVLMHSLAGGPEKQKEQTVSTPETGLLFCPAERRKREGGTGGGRAYPFATALTWIFLPSTVPVTLALAPASFSRSAEWPSNS